MKINTISGDFDQIRFNALLKEFNRAKASKLYEFEFEGKFLMTNFAGYLIEYLMPHFGSINPKGPDLGAAFEKLKTML